MEFYRFSKPGFQKRQSSKLKGANQRNAVLVSCSLNDDPKIIALHSRKDHALLGIFLEILFNLDFETESWEVRVDHFDRWARVKFADGAPNFKTRARLEWLHEDGVIHFEVQTGCLDLFKTKSKPEVNPIQTQGKPEVNTPFRQAETPVALRATKPTNQQIDLSQKKACENEIFVSANAKTERRYNRGYSDESKSLVQAFKKLLQESGQTVFQKDWYLTSLACCESLLKQGKPSAEIEKVMRWAVLEWDCKKSITHFKHVTTAYPHFERQTAASKPSASRPARKHTHLLAWEQERHFFHPGINLTFSASELEPINCALRRSEGRLDGFRLADGSWYGFSEFSIMEEQP